MATSPQSTPQKVKSTVDHPHIHAPTLETARNALFYTAAVTTVSLATIMDGIFPSVTSTQVDDVLQILQTNGSLKGEGWTAFEAMCSSKSKKANKVATYEPRHSSRNEDVTFKNLEQVFEEVGQAYASLHRDVADEDANGGETSLETVEGNKPPIVTLSIHGHKNLTSNWPNTTRPDGSIHLKKTSLPWPREEKVDFADICLMIETKLQMTMEDINDNRRKLLCNAHHKLWSDPRCRFVTGITVENTQTRFWYFDRGGILVSAPFNFMAEPRNLISIFLGYIVAPSEGALGFDTTIRCTGPAKGFKASARPEDDGSREYGITIHHITDDSTTEFHTIRCLANFGAVGICGRGTRVWEATKVDDPDPKRTYVLKDVWIDEGRIAEGARLQSIRQDASPEELQFFLEVDCHGAVLTKNRGLKMVDKTFKYPNSATVNPTTMVIQYAAPVPPVSSSAHTSGNSGSWERSTSRPSLSTSKRSRASPSTSTRSTADSSRSSDSGASTGIREELTSASYLIDDEHPHTPQRRSACRTHYRIAFTDPPGCAIRDLGTPRAAFEALLGGLKGMKAMLRQNLIHRDISVGNILLIERGEKKMGVLMDLEYAKEFPGDSNRPHAVRTGTKEFMAVEVLSLRYLFQPRSLDPYSLGWSHNPLHDVESVWWISVWILYNLAEIGLSDDDKQHRAELFSIADPNARLIFFHYFVTGDGFRQKLPTPIGVVLADWRIALLQFYEEQQLDLKNESHRSFNYDKVITDAIGRIESILIDLPSDSTVTRSLPSRSIIDNIQNSRGRSSS